VSIDATDAMQQAELIASDATPTFCIVVAAAAVVARPCAR
jgi:hypothetical protein